jgi:hypothetical protein
MGRRPLKHIHQFIDRHGKPRYYFRRPGQSVRLPGSPFSDEFMAAYQAAFNNQERPAIGANKVLPNSIRFLSITYYQSAEFQSLKSTSQQVRRLIIDRFCRETTDGKSNGDRSAAGPENHRYPRISTGERERAAEGASSFDAACGGDRCPHR